MKFYSISFLIIFKYYQVFMSIIIRVFYKHLYFLSISGMEINAIMTF